MREVNAVDLEGWFHHKDVLGNLGKEMMMFSTLSELFLYLPDLPRDTSESKRESEDPPSLTTRWGGGVRAVALHPTAQVKKRRLLEASFSPRVASSKCQSQDLTSGS